MGLGCYSSTIVQLREKLADYSDDPSGTDTFEPLCGTRLPQIGCSNVDTHSMGMQYG